MTESREAIEVASNQFMSAIQHGRTNVEGIVDFYTGDARLFPPGGDFGGGMEFRDAFDGSPEPIKRLSKEYVDSYWTHVFKGVTGGYKYGHFPLSIDVVDTVAYEVGDYNQGGTIGSKKGIYSILWRKENDEWKIAVHILNGDDRHLWLRDSEDELRKAIEQYHASLTHTNISKVVSAYTDLAEVFRPSGDIHQPMTKLDVLTFWRNYINHPSKKTICNTFMLNVHDDIAYELCSCRSAYSGEEVEIKSEDGTYWAIWKLQDNKWRIDRQMFFSKDEPLTGLWGV